MTGSAPGNDSPRDRKRLARQAGLGRLSFISALAGVLVAYGAFALLAALVGAVAVAVGVDAELASNDWTTFGMGSAVTATVVAFVAYLFGGYVAGRMARRAGLVNGLAVFVLALVVAVVVGAIVASQADTATIQANLRSLGLPITATEWAQIGTAAGIGTLVGMLVGAAIGGVVGERWHSDLARWAARAGAAPTATRTAVTEPARPVTEPARPGSGNPDATLRVTGQPGMRDRSAKGASLPALTAQQPYGHTGRSP